MEVENNPSILKAAFVTLCGEHRTIVRASHIKAKGVLKLFKNFNILQIQ